MAARSLSLANYTVSGRLVIANANVHTTNVMKVTVT
jgi:hypothetical protein